MVKLAIVLCTFALVTVSCSKSSSSDSPTAPAAPKVQLSGKNVVMDSNGNLTRLDCQAAYDYCVNQGMRLPTIREYAEYSLPWGVKGIRETAFPNSPITDAVDSERIKNRREGFFAVTKFTSDGVYAIDFYYSPEGGKVGVEDHPITRYWSMTVEPNSNYCYSFDFAIGNGGGIKLQTTDPNEVEAFECVKDQ